MGEAGACHLPAVMVFFWWVLSINGKRCVPRSNRGALLCLPIVQKGGLTMVTYSDLIQTGILVVGIIGLFIQILKK